MIADTPIRPSQTQNASDRLNLILDHAGFRKERGRIAELHSFICEKIPELREINYGTVRSWCTSGTTPPINKMKLICRYLAERIAMKSPEESKRESLSENLVTWWADGKHYPLNSARTDGLKIAYKQGTYRQLEVHDQAKVFALINRSSSSYSPITNLSPAKLEVLLDSIATSIESQAISVESEEMEKIVDALMILTEKKVIL